MTTGQLIVKAMRVHGELTLPDLRRYVPSGKRALWNALIRLMNLGKVERYGTAGQYVYHLAAEADEPAEDSSTVPLGLRWPHPPASVWAYARAFL